MSSSVSNYAGEKIVYGTNPDSTVVNMPLKIGQGSGLITVTLKVHFMRPGVSINPDTGAEE